MTRHVSYMIVMPFSLRTDYPDDVRHNITVKTCIPCWILLLIQVDHISFVWCCCCQNDLLVLFFVAHQTGGRWIYTCWYYSCSSSQSSCGSHPGSALTSSTAGRAFAKCTLTNPNKTSKPHGGGGGGEGESSIPTPGPPGLPAS